MPNPANEALERLRAALGGQGATGQAGGAPASAMPELLGRQAAMPELLGGQQMEAIRKGAAMAPGLFQAPAAPPELVAAEDLPRVTPPPGTVTIEQMRSMAVPQAGEIRPAAFPGIRPVEPPLGTIQQQESMTVLQQQQQQQWAGQPQLQQQQQQQERTATPSAEIKKAWGITGFQTAEGGKKLVVSFTNRGGGPYRLILPHNKYEKGITVFYGGAGASVGAKLRGALPDLKMDGVSLPRAAPILVVYVNNCPGLQIKQLVLEDKITVTPVGGGAPKSFSLRGTRVDHSIGVNIDPGSGNKGGMIDVPHDPNWADTEFTVNATTFKNPEGTQIKRVQKYRTVIYCNGEIRAFVDWTATTNWRTGKVLTFGASLGFTHQGGVEVSPTINSAPTAAEKAAAAQDLSSAPKTGGVADLVADN